MSGLELAGKSALVTGGSRGIGLAVARTLAAAGARVTLVARDGGRLQQVAQELGADWWALDVCDAQAVQQLAAELQGRAGGVPEILVNSAGAFHLAPIAETEIESFDRQLSVNLRAVFLLTRAFLPVMLQRRSGHIVTVGSVAGRVAFPHNGAYSASKFGVRGFHAVLSAELKETGVRATLIEPAATDTELWQQVNRALDAALPTADQMLSASAVARAVLYAVGQPPGVVVTNLLVERG
jgi:NADP-dependent 3-hydroxy acid dehydrogenase YdfG